jgi:hypothetical protein
VHAEVAEEVGAPRLEPRPGGLVEVELHLPPAVDVVDVVRGPRRHVVPLERHVHRLPRRRRRRGRRHQRRHGSGGQQQPPRGCHPLLSSALSLACLASDLVAVAHWGWLRASEWWLDGCRDWRSVREYL